MMSNIAIIYLIRLLGMAKYVGYTSQGIETRWKKHCCNAKNGGVGYALHRAIRKYGKDAFTIEVLYQSSDLDHTLNVKENEFIVEHKTHSSHGGYNMTLGGEGIVGRVPSEETLRKLSEAGKGKVASEETRRKISLANIGKVFSEEHRRKISVARMGRVVPEETRRKMSESHKRRAKLAKVGS